MDTKGLQKEFINWCKSKNKLPKSEDETKQLFVAFMKEKHPEEYKQAMENQQKQQATKALHGAKLNYFKSLKHQCAEDEEIVYYKRGGSVTCGCKKKEQGGEVPTAKDGAVAKFKNRKNIPAPQQQINPNDTIHVNGQIKSLTDKSIKDKNNTYKPLTPEEYKKLKDKDKNRVDEKDAARGRQVHKCGGKVKKGEDGLLPIKYPKGKPSKGINKGGTKSKIPVQSCGAKVKKDCGGSAIAKFKALRNGGSLNGIPFMQAGTPNGGIKDPKLKKYTTIADAYSNEAPTFYNIFNEYLNRLKASYYGNKAAVQEYDDKVNEYFKDLWSRGNYGKAIFGSPFVPIVKDYPPNRPLINYK